MGGLSGAKRGRFQGGGRTMNPRAAGAAGLRRRFPQPMQRLMPGQPGVSPDDPRLQWHALQGPGGGYSGGVIPRFQTGGLTSGPPQAPSPPSPSNFRYGFEHSGNYPWMPQSWRDRMAGLRTSVSARSLPQKLQQFQTRSGPNVTDILKEQPAWWPESARGWRAWQIPRRGIEGHSVGVAPTGTRNLSGSGGRGGYSGGVIPRFQAGGGAVGYGHGEDVGPRNVIDVSTPAGRRKHRALGQYWGPIGVRRIGTAEAKEAWANRARRQASRSPGGGYSGGVVPSFQTGGQFPEPAFPVESELADESPWYPDEEVGYEEEFPTQGGFDIFGRSGG